MVLGLLISENLLNAPNGAFNTYAVTWQDYQNWESVNASISKCINFFLDWVLLRRRGLAPIRMIKSETMYLKAIVWSHLRARACVRERLEVLKAGYKVFPVYMPSLAFKDNLEISVEVHL